MTTVYSASSNLQSNTEGRQNENSKIGIGQKNNTNGVGTKYWLESAGIVCSNSHNNISEDLRAISDGPEWTVHFKVPLQMQIDRQQWLGNILVWLGQQSHDFPSLEQLERMALFFLEDAQVGF